MNRKICKTFSYFSSKFSYFPKQSLNIPKNCHNFFPKWSFFVLLGTLLLLLSACHASPAPSTSEYTVELCISTPSLAELPLYYTYEKGHWKKEGLEVRLCDALTGNSTPGCLAATPYEAISSYEETPQNPYVMVAGVAGGGTFCINGSTPLTDLQSLSGQTIACGDHVFQRALLFHALLRENTEGVNLSFDTSGAYTLSPLPLSGAFGVFFYEETPSVFSTVLLTRKETWEMHSAAFSLLIQGMENGLGDLLQDTPEKIAKTVQSHYSEIDRETLTEYIRQFQAAGVWNASTQITEANFRLMINLLEETGCLPKEDTRLFSYKELCITR